MTEANLEDRQSSEDDAKKEALFSKEFREYLTSKKSSASTQDKRRKPFPLVRDYSASSGETTASESSRKSGRKVRKKVIKERQSHWDFNYALRNRLTQCSLLRSDEAVEPPEDLKPLLLNITILLQDLKQSPSEFENLYNLISRITILVTEFIRRPLKKAQETSGEQTKKVEKTVEMMTTLLEEYKNGPNLNSDNRIREYKRLEKEIAYKTHQIAEAESKLSESADKLDLRVKDLNLRVRNSILVNEKLKSEIKFNQSHVNKYKKMLVEKEWVKHKLETELRKKMSRVDLCDGEPLDKLQSESPEAILRNENVHVGFQLGKNKSTKLKKTRELHKSVSKLK